MVIFIEVLIFGGIFTDPVPFSVLFLALSYSEQIIFSIKNFYFGKIDVAICLLQTCIV
jgi:hypothetical protein